MKMREGEGIGRKKRGKKEWQERKGKEREKKGKGGIRRK